MYTNSAPNIFLILFYFLFLILNNVKLAKRTPLLLLLSAATHIYKNINVFKNKGECLYLQGDGMARYQKEEEEKTLKAITLFCFPEGINWVPLTEYHRYYMYICLSSAL